MWEVTKYKTKECGLIMIELMFAIPVLKKQTASAFNLVLFLNSKLFYSKFPVKSKAKEMQL